MNEEKGQVFSDGHLVRSICSKNDHLPFSSCSEIRMARIARCAIIVLLLLTMNWFSTIASTAPSRKNRRPSRLPFTAPFRSTSTLSRRGVPGMPGDIEWMGFYGSLLAVPTMLSVLGIVTNYNLEKSYFNSQLNAEYYRQTREMLRAHTAKLIKEQEEKFAKQGTTWKGMVYDQDGKVRDGARAPSWGGKVLDVEQEAPKKDGDGGGGGGPPASGRAGGGGGGGGEGVTGAGDQGATGVAAGAGQTDDARSGANGGTGPGGTEAGATSTGDGRPGETTVETAAGLAPDSGAGASGGMRGSGIENPDDGIGGGGSGDARAKDAAGAREGSGEDDSSVSKSVPNNGDQGSDSDSGDDGDGSTA